jgi:hypothetical protein
MIPTVQTPTYPHYGRSAAPKGWGGNRKRNVPTPRPQTEKKLCGLGGSD